MIARRRGPWPLIAWVAVLLVGGVVVPRRAYAQSAPAQDQRLEDLKRQLAELERTTAAQIAAIRQQIAALEPAPSPTVSTSAQPPAPVPTGAVPETFARDRETVARVNNVPVDPAMQGFFPIPGTPARVKIDGYAKLDAIIDTKPAGNTGRFIPSTIPIGLSDAQQTPSTDLHIRQTRLNLDFRSPTELGKDFRTFAEIDFFGPDAPFDPRLRHFYGQLANFLVGQTWTTFTDVDAFPDTLDDQGSSVAIKLRQAQVRYTQPLAKGQNIAFAIERPLTETRQISPTGAAYNPAPDVVVRYRFDRSRGHVQATSLFRTLGYRMEDQRQTALGIGGNIAGAWKVGADTVMGYTAFGKGIARYVENLVGTNSDVDLNDAGTELEALPAFGAYGAYTHKWSRVFRSTGVFGYTKITPTAAQPATSFLNSYYGLGNVLWNPVGSLDLGVEFIYGTHDVKDGEGAHAGRIQFAAKYDFFRKRPTGQ